jgi:phage regulator Rha-like protein
MMFQFAAEEVVYVGSALVAGAFMPAVGRKIKAGFVKLFTKGESALEARVKALEAKIVKDGEAAIKAAEAEVAKVV